MKKFYKSIIVIPILCLFFISCEKEVFVEPNYQLTNIQYAKLFINSNPPGVSIYVNGRNTGYKTPDTVRWLEDGTTNILLKKTNFADTGFSVISVKNVTERIFIDYSTNPRMYGKIVCSSRPAGAVIYLNNRNTGKVTPDTLKGIFPGEYTVKYEYPEFRKDSVAITVKSRVNSLVNVALEDTLDIVTYNSINSGFPSYSSNDIAEDKDGNMWIATSMYGLVKFDGKKFTVYNPVTDPFFPSDLATQVEVDKDNNVWAGFSNALIKYDGRNWEKTDSRLVNSITISNDNTMLAATDQGGIIKYKNGKYDFITSASRGLPNNWLVAACLDGNNRIWAALGTWGIVVENGPSWNYLDSARNGLPYAQCSALTLSPEGNILGIFWHLMPSSDRGPHTLARYDGTKWSPIFSKDALYGYRQIYIDKKGGIWLDMDGIKRINNEKSTTIQNVVNKNLRVLNSHPYLLQHTTSLEYFNFLVDSKENLWICGNKLYGLIKIKKGRWSY